MDICPGGLWISILTQHGHLSQLTMDTYPSLSEAPAPDHDGHPQCVNLSALPSLFCVLPSSIYQHMHTHTHTTHHTHLYTRTYCTYNIQSKCNFHAQYKLTQVLLNCKLPNNKISFFNLFFWVKVTLSPSPFFFFFFCFFLLVEATGEPSCSPSG